MVENDASGSDNHRYHENEPAQPDSEGKTETPANPYRSPKTTVPSPLKPGKKRLTVFDWVLAIFLGGWASIFIFPTTCIGTGILLPIPEPILVSGLLSLAAGVYVVMLVLRLRSNRKSR